jgi:hypothetical protein
LADTEGIGCNVWFQHFFAASFNPEERIYDFSVSSNRFACFILRMHGDLFASVLYPTATSVAVV